MIASGPDVQVTTWDFQVASNLVTVLWDWALTLWDLMITQGRWCQN